MRWLPVSALFPALVASSSHIHTQSLGHALLNAEIQATELLLTLYRRQAKALAMALEHPSPSFESTFDATSRSLSAWQPLEASSAEPHHGLDTVLVDKATHMFDPDVVALQIVSWRVHAVGRRRKLVDTEVETLDFLAVARSSGLLEIRNPRTFALLWQAHTHVDSIVSIHQHAGTRSALAVVSSHGDVTVFSVRVFENGRLRVGEPQRDRPTDRSVCLVDVAASPPKVFQWGEALPKVTSSPAPVGLHVDISRLFQTPRAPASSGAKVLLLQVNYDIFVVVATSHGDLSVYTHGGHCVYHATFRQPIAALAALLGGSIAFTIGTDVGIINIPQWDFPVQVCAGSTHPLVSLERDVHRPSILYAGTSAGTVLVLRLHRSFSQRQPRAPCSVQQQLVPQESDAPLSTAWGAAHSTSSPVQLGSLKRLLFVLANQTFAGYQFVDTDVAKRLFAVEWNSAKTTLLVTKDKPHDALIVLASRLANGSTMVVVHETLVVLDTSLYDVSWVRAPLMVLCAGGFVVWQKYRKKVRPPGLDQDEIMHVARQLQRQSQYNQQ